MMYHQIEFSVWGGSALIVETEALRLAREYWGEETHFDLQIRADATDYEMSTGNILGWKASCRSLRLSET